MRIVKVGLSLLVLFLSSCATSQLGKNSSEWRQLRDSEAFKKERNIYQDRMNGRHFCWDVGVSDFLKSSAPRPNSKCIYPASKFVTGLDDGVVFKSKTLNQNFKQLKVLQVTPQGFVIENLSIDGQPVYIHKTEETGLADGSYLDSSQDWQVYEYAGTFSYTSLLGTKTVHSFRRITKQRLESASKGLKLYKPTRDFFIENGLWDYVGEFPEK